MRHIHDAIPQKRRTLVMALWKQRKNETVFWLFHSAKCIIRKTMKQYHCGHGNVNMKHHADSLKKEGKFRLNELLNDADSYSYASLLQAAIDVRSLAQGKLVHAHIVKSGFEPDVYLQTKILILYVKCGSLSDGRRILDGMTERNVVSWTAMVVGYEQIGHLDEAAKLFDKMSERNVVSWNAMITGHAQSGHLRQALKLFQEMPQRNLISWNAIIGGCAQNGYNSKALELFIELLLARVKPNSVTFTCVLPAFGSLGSFELAKEIYGAIIRSGLHSDIRVGSALIDLYAKCRSMESTRKMFDKMPERNLISWNAILAGYAQNGLLEETQKLFQEMPERDMTSWSTMVAGHSQCGYVDEATKLFQKMPEKNTVSWNANITGNVHNGRFDESLNLFQQMQLTGMKPNSVTLASVLPACANLVAFEHGKELHGCI